MWRSCLTVSSNAIDSICPGLFRSKPNPFSTLNSIYPGLNLAQATVFAVCARVLAAFEITKAVENDREVSPVVAYGPGAVR